MPAGDLSERVTRLLHQVPRAPEQPYPGGATDHELNDLTLRLGIPLPGELAAWLRLCKGEAIGPGGVFGARPDRETADIAAHLAWHPQWRARNWLPVAGDGCGNYYLLTTTGQLAGFVAFVDMTADPDRLEHVVASNLWQFLFFLFTRELGEPGWPFDPHSVLAEDPQIAGAPPELLPWTGR
ncbi:SMI1/KNR4 family protein [Plantactinospora sp. S1510]|uniref:SMI1/KNR4 family protein n=1 Tax=Plantactinospora alkalitolerans TaxID=2789879 RepID=A0ABS0H918_9ACTN|nr:SMI1/KNR4 family protein [Plantactinospora alkalitolerans]MBF9134962.1 SMI1/KNR4 family protein [Plantactinospora alkalitolerans]